jgi:hypothetical protein
VVKESLLERVNVNKDLKYLVLRRLRQEHCKFKASVGYTEILSQKKKKSNREKIMVQKHLHDV